MAEKATRDAFGEALKEIGAEFPNVVVLDADLSVSTKSAVFAKAYPARFFEMGIAESNMIGTAAGLSFTGLVPFACSFGCFVVGRYETIRLSIGYSRANVKIVGTHAGLGIGEDGYSQMALEDLSVLRALPGMTIIQPADEITTRAAVRFSTMHFGPVYLRLTRQKLPSIHKSETVFQCGRGIIMKEGGNQLALFGTGATVSEALRVSDTLSSMNPWVIDFHTIKPIDRALIKSIGSLCQVIVTIEDHNVVGGLGSAVADVLAEQNNHSRLVRIGVSEYGESGSPIELYDKYGLSADKIVSKLKEVIA